MPMNEPPDSTKDLIWEEAVREDEEVELWDRDSSETYGRSRPPGRTTRAVDLDHGSRASVLASTGFTS